MVLTRERYTNNEVILNDDCTLDKEIHCSLGDTFDNGIEIIDINSTKTERRIKTSKQCRGITHQNGVLLWCEVQRGILMMKLTDDRVTTLVKQSNLPYYSYITTCGDKIYQTNHDTSTVTCYSIKGGNVVGI